jgi:hypothetical protein
MDPELTHKLGGVAGGMLRVTHAVGHRIVSVFVGSRFAERTAFQARVFLGGLVIGGCVGVLASFLVRSDAEDLWFLGLCGGAVLGMFVAGIPLALVHDAIRENAGTTEEWRQSWKAEVKAAGVSAHEVDEVMNFDDEKRSAYFKKYRLSREDNKPPVDAHYKAFLQVKGKWRGAD